MSPGTRAGRAVLVELSPDKMRAYLSFSPEKESGGETSETVKRALKKRGVSHGIDDQAILEALRSRGPRRVCIAQGTPPDIGGDPETKITFTEGALVAEGEILARVRYARPPRPGRDVTGEDVAPLAGLEDSIPDAGENVYFIHETQRWEARTPGYPAFDGKIIRLEPLVGTTDDEMSASMTLRPVPQNQAAPDVATILKLIEQSGVVFGLFEETVADAVRRHAEQPRETLTVHIAQGKPLIPGNDGRVTLNVEVGSRTGKRTEDGRVDFHHLNLCRDVEADDLLAYRVPPSEGSAGTTVTGMVQLAQLGAEERLIAGQNVQVVNNGLEFRAVKDGILFVSDGRLRVLQTYDVEENVDFATGDIETAHRVVIRGSVVSEFSVQAGGAVEIGEHVEDAILDSGAGIEVRGGITHGELGSVSARHDVRAKYALNARIQAQGSIELGDSSFHSELVAGDAIRILRGKGVLMGGKAIAGNVVEVNVAGSKQGVPTVIHVGHDHRAIAPVEKKLRELGREMAALMGLIGRDLAGYVRGEKAPPESKHVKKLLRRWKSLEARRKALWLQRDKTLRRSAERLSSNPRIVVRRVLHPGVMLIMGRARLLVEQERRGARFAYCRESNAIVAE